MHLCRCWCLRLCACVCMYMYVLGCLCTPIRARASVRARARVCVCGNPCARVRTRFCMRLYVCTYIYMYVFIHSHTWGPLRSAARTTLPARSCRENVGGPSESLLRLLLLVMIAIPVMQPFAADRSLARCRPTTPVAGCRQPGREQQHGCERLLQPATKCCR